MPEPITLTSIFSGLISAKMVQSYLKAGQKWVDIGLEGQEQVVFNRITAEVDRIIDEGDLTALERGNRITQHLMPALQGLTALPGTHYEPRHTLAFLDRIVTDSDMAPHLIRTLMMRRFLQDKPSSHALSDLFHVPEGIHGPNQGKHLRDGDVLHPLAPYVEAFDNATEQAGPEGSSRLTRTLAFWDETAKRPKPEEVTAVQKLLKQLNERKLEPKPEEVTAAVQKLLKQRNERKLERWRAFDLSISLAKMLLISHSWIMPDECLLWPGYGDCPTSISQLYNKAEALMPSLVVNLPCPHPSEITLAHMAVLVLLCTDTDFADSWSTYPETIQMWEQRIEELNLTWLRQKLHRIRADCYAVDAQCFLVTLYMRCQYAPKEAEKRKKRDPNYNPPDVSAVSELKKEIKILLKDGPSTSSYDWLDQKLYAWCQRSLMLEHCQQSGVTPAVLKEIREDYHICGQMLQERWDKHLSASKLGVGPVRRLVGHTYSWKDWGQGDPPLGILTKRTTIYKFGNRADRIYTPTEILQDKLDRHVKTRLQGLYQNALPTLIGQVNSLTEQVEALRNDTIFGKKVTDSELTFFRDVKTLVDSLVEDADKEFKPVLQELQTALKVFAGKVAIARVKHQRVKQHKTQTAQRT